MPTSYGQLAGSGAEGWTREKAEEALRHTLADVERGIWRPPDREVIPPTLPQDPTFHELASQWYQANEGSWRPNTRVDYQWQLTNHLLPFFAGHRGSGSVRRGGGSASGMKKPRD